MGSAPRFDTDQVFDPDDYLHFYGSFLTPERTDREATHIASLLQVGTGDGPVLDLACGHGRHLAVLRARGIRVVGIDRSAGFLGASRRAAPSRQPLVRGDMRTLPFRDGRFAAVYCYFTSFGYFADDENARVVAEAARVLAPGGRFLVETMNPFRILRNFLPVFLSERDQDIEIDRTTYDPLSGRIQTHRTTLRDGRRRDMEFTVRLYFPTEWRALLESAGLVAEAFAGAPGEETLGVDSRRLTVLARKPA